MRASIMIYKQSTWDNHKNVCFMKKKKLEIKQFVLNYILSPNNKYVLCLSLRHVLLTKLGICNIYKI